MNKELSNCCKSEVKIGGDDKEGTHYYICTKCNKPCDLYSEIRELSDEELLESCLNLYAIINNPTVSYPNAKFVGFVDGIGWYVRKGDLKRMVTAYEDVFTFHKEELKRFEKLLIETLLKK